MKRVVTCAGGLMLIASLSLSWADAGGVRLTGFELLTTGDVLLAIAGVTAVLAAVTGGRFGLFRPDLSLNGAADLLGVVSTVVLAWLVFFDFPDGAAREPGVWLALAGAVTAMSGAGDYAVLRGAPAFPALVDGDEGARRPAPEGTPAAGGAGG